MKTLVIYSDGSDFKKTNHRLGIGAVLVDPETGKMLDWYQQEISPQFMRMYYSTEDCSNPTMEMLAALQALEKFKDKIKGYSVVLKADYIGVSSWMSPVKPWKINAPYIRKIKDDITELIRKNGLVVSFEWVKGHQSKSIKTPDAFWNDIVDKLAKGEKITGNEMYV